MFNDNGYKDSMHELTERENESLKGEISALQEGLATRESVIGKLNVELEILKEANSATGKELTTWQQECNNKSMKNLDLSKRVRTLEAENHDLQAQVGRLTGKIAETWEDGLRKYIHDQAREALDEARDAHHDNW